MARRDAVDEIDNSIHADSAQIPHLITEFVEIIPAVRSTGERDAIANETLGKKLHGGVGQLLHCARAMESTVISQAGLANAFDAFAHPGPRILLELAHVFLDHDRDKKFHRFETDAVHLCGGAEHRIGLHPQRPETLLAIAESSVDEGNLSHRSNRGYWSVGVLGVRTHHCNYFFALLCSNSFRI